MLDSRRINRLQEGSQHASDQYCLILESNVAWPVKERIGHDMCARLCMNDILYRGEDEWCPGKPMLRRIAMGGLLEGDACRDVLTQAMDGE